MVVHNCDCIFRGFLYWELQIYCHFNTFSVEMTAVFVIVVLNFCVVLPRVG
jgi:hypothetical protein